MFRKSVTRFSLIVATVGRRRELDSLLESLRGQRERDFEVIIVDQNEPGFLADIVEYYSSLLRLIHVRSERLGASHARNLGIECASGEIMTFPDDDCEFPLDLLEKIDGIFRSDASLGGVTISSKDKRSSGGVARLSCRGGGVTKFNILKRCIEAGIFLRREILNGHRFDELMGVGAESPWWSDEGPDLLLSVLNDGERVEFFPELVIFHPDPRREYNENSIERAMRYGRGRGHYLRKHSYPAWFVIYVWGLYVIGICLGMVQLNAGKTKYYFNGLKGRIRGFFDDPKLSAGN